MLERQAQVDAKVSLHSQVEGHKSLFLKMRVNATKGETL